MALEIKRAAVRGQFKAIEASAKADGVLGSFSGYGSVFGVLDSYDDIVLPGAFAETLKAAKDSGVMPAMLWQHDPAQPIGVWSLMREDDTGLYVEGQILDTQTGRDAYTLLKAGALSGLSIGYSVDAYVIRKDETLGREVRDLSAISLWEVSPVTFPANDSARVESVKYTGPSMTVREFEKFLRDAGHFSNAQAKAIAARGFKSLRDADDEDDTQYLEALARRLSATL